MSDSTVSGARYAEEQKLSRGMALGLPVVTVTTAAIVGVIVGPATSILVLAAGVLLGVIALLWNSIRILSGEAALAPEIEALDLSARGVDVLATRKKMLLRALKDLQNEHSIGKMEDEDYQQLSTTYREELKTVLKRIDENLAPHRAKAESAAKAHLASVGLGEGGYRGGTPRGTPLDHRQEPKDPLTSTDRTSQKTKTCPKCSALNDDDAKFCKECATSLQPESSRKHHDERDRVASAATTTTEDDASTSEDHARE